MPGVIRRWFSRLTARLRRRRPPILQSLREARGKELGDGTLMGLWAAYPDQMERLERSYLRAQQVLPPDERSYAVELVKSVVVTVCDLPADVMGVGRGSR
jgi:hypothetical protein